MVLAVQGPAPKLKRLDKTIGDYSYPIYLFHWQAGLWASLLLFGNAYHGFSTKGLLVLIVSLLFVILLSYLLINGVDAKIQVLRTKIKAIPTAHENRQKRRQSVKA